MIRQALETKARATALAIFTKYILPVLLVFGAIIGIIFIVLMVMDNLTVKDDSITNDDDLGYWGGEISSIGKNEIPADFIPVYKAAEKEYGVPWNLLAAHHRVETRFSTIHPMVSPVGATGHMQFMPCTWVGWGHPSCGGLGKGNISNSELTSLKVIKKYGGYGVDGSGDGKADPNNFKDAVFSAANYLAANGASKGKIREAVFAYNHADWYVEEVLSFADAYVNGYVPIDGTIGGTGKWKSPISGGLKVTSPFGWRILDGKKEFHKGVDFGCIDKVTPIHAVDTGKVVYSEFNNGGYGNAVIIKHGKDLYSHYAHMSARNVKVGQTVKQGQRVGVCGQTGQAFGAHLHLEAKTEEWGGHYDSMKLLK